MEPILGLNQTPWLNALSLSDHARNVVFLLGPFHILVRLPAD